MSYKKQKRCMQSTKSTEDLLVERCKKKDSKAQQAVYEKYSGKLLSICKRYLNNQDAEDVMAMAFVKIFGKIHQFQHKGSFEGWMRRIVVNQCLAYLQKTKKRYLEVDIEDAGYQDTQQTVVSSLQEEDLLTMIQSLPVGYRTVFNLYAIEGYSHKEVAKQLKISEGTSKSQLSRARILLQQKLKQVEKIKEVYHVGQ
ncbi:MAG: RNA polymerase sigma factor [Cyclobacteriaceae bacterium]